MIDDMQINPKNYKNDVVVLNPFFVFVDDFDQTQFTIDNWSEFIRLSEKYDFIQINFDTLIKNGYIGFKIDPL